MNTCIYSLVNLCSVFFFNIKFELKYAGESINIDDEILENVDTNKFGKKKTKHYIRYRTKNMYNTFFKYESVTVRAQLLLCLIKSRKLKVLEK
jgi:hypothetical protein